MAVFGKKSKELIDSQIQTIISEGCHIDGNIKTDSTIRIDGSVQGNVDAKQGLILGGTGTISGDVNAAELVVYGKIEGNLNTSKLEIKSSGVITGDIRTEIIEVEFGAVYNGKVSMHQAGSHQKQVKKEAVLETA